MSFQHFWFNRRFRLANFGDFEIGNIFDVEVNDNDIRKWICYVEAKVRKNFYLKDLKKIYLGW